MTQTINYAFIGCGMMGHEHLNNLALIPGSNVTAILEPDAGMRTSAAKLAPNATFEPNLEAILARDDIDAWVITTPNYQHADQLKQLFAHSDKPILVEKPACTDPADVLALRDLAANHPAPVWVVCCQFT